MAGLLALGFLVAIVAVIVLAPYDPGITAADVKLAQAGAKASASMPIAALDKERAASMPVEPNALSANEHDFGYVEPGSRHSTIFTVMNPYDQALTITRVFSECKCMHVFQPPKMIPPKGSVDVEVVLVAPKESMHYDQKVILRTKDSRLPKILLRVKADIGLAVKVEPAVLDLGALAAGQETVASVKVSNRDSKPLHVVYSKSDSPACFATMPATPFQAAAR